MRKFTPESAVDVIELQQLVADWCHELDTNGGLDVAKLFTEDCIVDFGRVSYTGRAATTKFYQDRAERVRTQQKDGIRTQRHGITNIRIVFEGKDRAHVTFLIINFSGEGGPPLMNATTPTIVTDTRFECRHDTDGVWRIKAFYGTPIFIGNDPFLNQGMVGPKT
ncbi:MAG: nuclear transport factor 2 family protein [Rhodospirillaceae bacterium]|nr:MAG: nuclear transport factor 2 family protein [Rhodospirillaceae bacterium]